MVKTAKIFSRWKFLAIPSVFHLSRMHMYCGEYVLVDPTLSEEAVMDRRMVVGMNIHREICALQMSGGMALLPELV